jgi:DNA mismatch repair ATPase MutS
VLQVWQAMSAAMSSLDVLAALARFAQHDGGATCFPQFISNSDSPKLTCEGLWHPALAATSSSQPIPTDVDLGSSKLALLLTGPNMVRSSCRAVHL